MKRLTWLIGLLLVVALLLPVSCAKWASKSEGVLGGITVPGVAPMPAVRETPPTEVYKEGAADVLSSTAEERMIIRNGNISLVVEDVVEARDEVAQVAVKLDGYVVSSWIAGEGREMRGNISIRVPDEKFELTLTELRNLAVRVESESTSSQDVTEEYVDLEARLKNAEATESQYLALLKQAKTVEEMLKVYDSLSRVRSEIEQMKGRMQYLERTSSMSLITVQLQPAATAKPLIPVGWSALEALKSAIRGIVTLGQWLATIIIWVLILSPIWGTVLGIFWWRRHQKRKA